MLMQNVHYALRYMYSFSLPVFIQNLNISAYFVLKY